MIYLNIYGIRIEIDSNSAEIISRLSKEFHFFLASPLSSVDLKVESKIIEKYPFNFIPENLKPTFQRHNSITYDLNNIRWNDYYGRTISKLDLNDQSALVLGIDFDKLYEITYLLILSISGKLLDLKGFHKIHALAFTHQSNTFICMQPTRGGKSTLLLELIKNHRVKILSDDSPIFNSNLEVLPFPIHISLEDFPSELNISPDNYFQFNREFQKPKYSIAITSDLVEIAKPQNKYIFIEAKRSTFKSPKIEHLSKFKLFLFLLKHMVIGVGLPIIFEYFWVNTHTDFLKKIHIFFSRLIMAFKISIKMKGYVLYQNQSPADNAQAILELKQS